MSVVCEPEVCENCKAVVCNSGKYYRKKCDEYLTLLDRAEGCAETWKALAREMRRRWIEAEGRCERAHDEIEALLVEVDESREDLAAERRRSEECEL